MLWSGTYPPWILIPGTYSTAASPNRSSETIHAFDFLVCSAQAQKTLLPQATSAVRTYVPPHTLAPHSLFHPWSNQYSPSFHYDTVDALNIAKANTTALLSTKVLGSGGVLVCADRDFKNVLESL